MHYRIAALALVTLAAVLLAVSIVLPLSIPI
ncbi:hypothetical protein [Burkholderia phage vB_BglM_WTB]